MTQTNLTQAVIAIGDKVMENNRLLRELTQGATPPAVSSNTASESSIELPPSPNGHPVGLTSYWFDFQPPPEYRSKINEYYIDQLHWEVPAYLVGKQVIIIKRYEEGLDKKADAIAVSTRLEPIFDLGWFYGEINSFSLQVLLFDYSKPEHDLTEMMNAHITYRERTLPPSALS